MVDNRLIPSLLQRAQGLGVARHFTRRRFGAAGGHGVDADAVDGVLHRQAHAHGVYPAFGRGIGNAVDAAGGNRRNIHNAAALLGNHRRQHGAAAPQRGKQRAAHFGFDFGFGIFLIRLGPDGAAHIVHGHIHASELGHRRIHHALRTGKGFQIGHHGEAFAAGAADGLGGVVHKFAAVGQHHGAAFCRQRQRHTLADALRSAGNDADFVVKTRIHKGSYFCSLAENFSK